MASTTRQALLQALSAAEGAYISGQQLAQQLGVSRAAVHKAAAALTAQGYALEAASRRGYRLLGGDPFCTEAVGPYPAPVQLYDTLESTNRTAKLLALEGAVHGTLVLAGGQTAGRGQRGHSWTSPEGENLTFTLVLEPVFLPVGEQFLLSEAVTLALTDTFAAFGIDARIKWTNDIYVGDKKLVGILIEHSYSGPTLARTIAGIGINVNQTEFDPALPNPVSMAMVAGRTFDRGEVLEAFRRHIGIRYAQLELDERETLQRDYRERMYRLGERHTFRYPDGTPTEASIEGVRPTGELLLRHADGTLREYLFKEIEFVIAGK